MTVARRRQARPWDVADLNRISARIVLYLLLLTVVVTVGFPLFWMVSASFRVPADLYATPPTLRAAAASLLGALPLPPAVADDIAAVWAENAPSPGSSAALLPLVAAGAVSPGQGLRLTFADGEVGVNVDGSRQGRLL